MSSKDIRAGRAFVEIGINDKTAAALARVQARLTAFSTATRAIGTAMTGIGVAGLSALVGAAKHFADTGSELHDMADRTGIAADRLSELKFAAEQSGASIGDVEKAIRFMQKQGLDPAKLEEFGKALWALKDPNLRAAAALKLFGKAGTSILPMLKELPALTAMARATGNVLSPEQARSADDLGDAWGRLKAAMSGVVNQVGAAMAPAFTAILDVMTPLVAGLAFFIKANQMLVVVGAVALGVITAIGGAFLVAAGAAAIIAAGIAAIPVIVGVAGAAFAALVSPIGLVITALAAATAAVVTLGVTFRREIANMLKLAIIGAEQIAKQFGGENIVNSIRGMKIALETMAGVAKSKFPKIRVPDFGGDFIGESSAGVMGSKGQFGGFRAESLGVGSGGGVVGKKLDGIKQVLEDIKNGVDRNVKATEEIDGEEFE